MTTNCRRSRRGRVRISELTFFPSRQTRPVRTNWPGFWRDKGSRSNGLTEEFRACNQTFEAGSYVINLAQPAKRLIRTLMDQDIPIDDEFMKEQERRRAKALPDEIYDVTAWSLPLMMNIEAVACDRPVSVDSVLVEADNLQPGTVSGGEASVAYLVPWGESTAVRFLSNALRQGLTVKSSDKAFTNQDTRYPAGTLIIDVVDNDETLHRVVEALAHQTGANVVAVNDSWVTDGPNFGSRNVVRHNLPKVAIAWDMRRRTPTALEIRNSLSSGKWIFQ